MPMAEQNQSASACPLALQERQHDTTNDATIDPLRNEFSGLDSTVSKNHKTQTGRENGDVFCNGKGHLPFASNKSLTTSEDVIAHSECPNPSGSFKKPNGLICSERSSGDSEIVNSNSMLEISKVNEDQGHSCHGDSENISETSQNGTQDYNASSGGTCHLSDEGDTKQTDVDVVLNKLEDVSIVSPSDTCDKTCEIPDRTKVSVESNDNHGIEYVVYESEKQMPDIMRLITKDLSEPYSIYTYRYFIHNWPRLCFLAKADDKCVGAIVCKLDLHKKMARRGYIAMLAVDSEYRRRQIGSTLVTKAIEAMIRDDCDEVVLETEITNQGALHLYENLGFVRDKRLFRYYLNGVDALRLKLWLR